MTNRMSPQNLPVEKTVCFREGFLDPKPAVIRDEDDLAPAVVAVLMHDQSCTTNHARLIARLDRQPGPSDGSIQVKIINTHFQAKARVAGTRKVSIDSQDIVAVCRRGGSEVDFAGVDSRQVRGENKRKRKPIPALYPKGISGNADQLGGMCDDKVILSTYAD